MKTGNGLLYDGEPGLLATMHAKEKVIGPLVERFLGLRIEAVTGLNTDVFGTFSRDIARTGSQLDAARAKIQAGFETLPDISVGLASEGSFGPHPGIPFCALDREIVVLVDRKSGLELIGHYATPDTNFSHVIATDVAAGRAFAEKVGFPQHGVIVMACRDGHPAPDIAVVKALGDYDELTSALQTIIAKTGSAFVETDMRAHRNPRRMRAIKHSTIDLVRLARSPCPACGRPGYAVTERLAGLQCSWCGGATLLARAEVLSCVGCNWRVERPVGGPNAGPEHCGECNP